MTKKQFKTECEELEKQGYSLVEFEPYNKFAVYTRNGNVRTIGVKK